MRDLFDNSARPMCWLQWLAPAGNLGRARCGVNSVNINAIGIYKGSCSSEEADTTPLPQKGVAKADDAADPCFRIYNRSC